jgi:hypothetical protein
MAPRYCGFNHPEKYGAVMPRCLRPRDEKTHEKGGPTRGPAFLPALSFAATSAARFKSEAAALLNSWANLAT